MNGIEAAVAGRVSSETIEVKTSQAGKSWTAFSVRVGEGESIEYIRVSAIEPKAERLAVELKKGDGVYCEGRLTLWRSVKDGIEKASLQMAASRQDGQRTGNGQADEAARNWQRPLDAEIPFAAEVR